MSTFFGTIQFFDVEKNTTVDSMELGNYLLIDGKYWKWGYRYTAFQMYTNDIGVCVGGHMDSIWFFRTFDGWKSYNKFKYYYRSDVGSAGDDYMGVSHQKLISPDSIMFWGSGYIDSSWMDLGFYYMIFESDTVYRFEPFGLPIDKKGGKSATDFERLNDSTLVYVALGEAFGAGDNSCHQIFKTTDGGYTFREVYKSKVKGAFGLDDIYFIDSLNGIAAGSGITLFTSDAGETWQVNDLYYDFDGTLKKEKPWQSYIKYIDGMTFLYSWTDGLYKLKDGFSSVFDEVIHQTKLYPNPIQAGKILYMDIIHLTSAHAYIYDIHGQLVSETEFFGNSVVIPPDISVGTYFIVVESDGRYPIREKFFVE